MESREFVDGIKMAVSQVRNHGNGTVAADLF
jgi:hypothetical protein